MSAGKSPGSVEELMYGKALACITLGITATALTATAASPLTATAVAASLMGGAAGNYFHEFADNCQDTIIATIFRRETGIDENHHILLALRDAHWAAMGAVLKKFDDAWPELLKSEQREEAKRFSREAKKLLAAVRKKRTTGGASDFERSVLVGLPDALDSALAARGSSPLPTAVDDLTQTQRKIEEAALAELAEQTGTLREEVPPLFETAFFGSDGWFELFVRDGAIRLKSNQDFSTIWTAEKIARIDHASKLILTELQGFEERIGDKITEVDRRLEDMSRQMQTAFSEKARTFTTNEFAIGTENGVIFAWYEGGPDWWEKSANHLRSALDRLGPGYELAPLAWDFSRFDLVSTEGRNHARSGLWGEFSIGNGNKHAASVVFIGTELSEPIPCGNLFEERLEACGLLSKNETTCGFFVADGMEPDAQRKKIRAGGIPITLETRLILETWLAQRPLLVVDGRRPGECATAVNALFEWLTKVEIAISQSEDMQNNDRWAIPFVRTVFDITVAAVPNPYRRLDHYLPENAAQFFGRERQTEQVRLWLAAHRGVLSITGPSGVGKSSFLYARVAWLVADAGYEHVIFRPTDLKMGYGQHRPVLGFCEMLADRLGLGPVDHPLVGQADAEQAGAAALEWAEGAIAKDRRLFLAIDQFEEIVDNIANGLSEAGWRAVLSLVTELSERWGYPLAITLEDSRRAIYDKFMADTPYHNAAEIALADNDENFARAIITEPFADAGFLLDDGVIDRLVSEFTEHSADNTGGTSASALPLLALKLYSLFNHITRSPTLSAKSSKQVFGHGGAAITLNDLGDFPLSITEEIKNLADQAWNETNGGTQADLGAFLRPFISVLPAEDGNKGGSGRLVLNSVPARQFYSAADRQNAFLQRRLIVPTPGGYRLTHQAVIHRWPFAAAWFKKEADNILRQVLFLQKAVEWDEVGRPAIEAASPEDVALAAQLLSARAIDWAVSDPIKLPIEDRRDRDYAIAVFSMSESADERIEGNAKGNRHIHTAAAYGITDMLRRMLDLMPDAIGLRRDDNGTALANAAWANAEVVAFLLERGADPHLPDKDGFGPLDSAIWGGNDAVFNLLITKMDPENSPENRINPLYSAAYRGRMDYIIKLEQQGFKHDGPSLHDLNSLMGAAMNGDVVLFEYCLARCNITRRSDHGFTAFDLLAQKGVIDLMFATLRHPDGLSCLKAGPDGTTPLMRAAQGLQPASVRFLLKAGIDPNAQSHMEGLEGGTALHFTLDWLSRHSGRAPRFVADMTRETLGALLESDKIDVGVADEKGRTAYDMARHHPGLQAMLVAHESFVPTAIPAGSDTPLHSAIKLLRKNIGNDNVEGLQSAIRDLLADERYIGILCQPGSEKKIPVVELIDLGLVEELLALVEAGKLDPWSETAGAAILPAAWRAQHADLGAAAVARMPEIVTVDQAVSLANALCDVDTIARLNASDPDFSILKTCISRCPDPQTARNRIVITAALLGNLALFDQMLADGADLNVTDDWGRDVVARSSDMILANRAGASPAKSIAPAQKQTNNYRGDLAAGDVAKIRKVLKSLPKDSFPDDWGRMPVDFVPDAIADKVRKLQSGSNGKGSFWKRIIR